LEIPAKISKIAATPAPDGTYRIDLIASWPQGFIPVIGATAEVSFVSYFKPAAIVVPTKSLTFAAEGWTVAVKLADGKTEARLVIRGRASKDETEILSGLEIGQVVVVP